MVATTDPSIGRSHCQRARPSSSAAAIELASARFARGVAGLGVRMLAGLRSCPAEHLFG